MNKTLNKKAFLLLLAILIASTIFQLCSIKEPITGDASFFSTLQREMVGEADSSMIDLGFGEPIVHPMLYQNSLLIIGKIFGTDLIYARGFGVFCFFANCLLIFLIVFEITKNSQNRHYVSLFSILLYALNPFAIQGSLHLDIDNTVLTTVILANILYFFKINDDLTLKKTLFMSILFSLSLWCKLTTPLLLPLAFFLYFLLSKNYQKAFIFSSGIFLVGTTIFLVTWILYCSYLNFPYFSIFTAILSVFFRKAGEGIGSIQTNSLLRALLTTVYWIGPYLFITFLFLAIKQIKNLLFQRGSKEIGFFIFLGLMVFVGYIFVGGIMYGIPKYHYILIPIMAITISLCFANQSIKIKNTHFVILGLCLAGMFFYFFLIGDPLYKLNMGLKKFILEHNLPITTDNNYMKNIYKDFIFYLIPLVPILVIFLRRYYGNEKCVLIYLILLCFGNYLGMNVLQAKAPYNTIYSYGGVGIERIYDTIKVNSKVLLMEGGIYLPFDEKVINFYSFRAKNKDELINFIKKTRPDYFITGLSLNTLDQFYNILNNPGFLKFMSEEYLLNKEGTYFYWERITQRKGGT